VPYQLITMNRIIQKSFVGCFYMGLKADRHDWSKERESHWDE
jgi:hypothetical protein